MIVEGSQLHYKCGGLGIIIDKDGTGEVCAECMGSGMVNVVIEEQLPEIYVVRDK